MSFPRNPVGAGEPDADDGVDSGQGAAPNPFKKTQMKGFKAGVKKIRNSSTKGMRKSGGVVKGPSFTKAVAPDK